MTLRSKEGEWLARGHIAAQEYSWDQNAGLLAPGSVLLGTVSLEREKENREVVPVPVGREVGVPASWRELGIP